MKVNYAEGTWFAIPLRTNGFAVGLAARATTNGPHILAYFFGPKRESIPSWDELPRLSASSAVKVARISDLHLIDGRWPIIGHSPNFRREAWPFPRFLRSDEMSRRAAIVQYSEDDPGCAIANEHIEFGTSTLERDALLGAGAVELVLTKLLE